MTKKGILIVNLGTPKSPTTAHVREYLKVFLSDPRVIKTPPAIWKPILNGIILRTRPQKSAKLYESIWRKEGSPLLVYAKQQQAYLQALLPDTKVALAMSYSHPFIPEAIDQLLAEGIDDLTILPLYPQYSGTTVGSVFDDVMKYFVKSDKIINLHFVRSFYDHPLYIQYFADKIKAKLAKQPVDALLFTYHGIPVSYVTDGDDYPSECTKTTELIMQQLGDVPFYQTYQSKFGPAEWLTPATDATLTDLPKKGVKKILVIAPGFVADCLETIEELEEENKGYFMENGGEEFYYLPPFNDDPQLAEILKQLATN